MRRILVVEDEMLVAMLIEDILIDLGFAIVGPAMRLDTALELAAEADFDLAILDINLAGEKSFPVAERLTAKGIPFVFVSGYGRAGLEAPFLESRVVQKPFDATALSHVIQLAASDAAGAATRR